MHEAMDGEFNPKKETFTCVPVCIRFYSLPLEYWIPKTLNRIGDSLIKLIKISKETLQGRYKAYTKICVEMDVSGTLPEAFKLQFRDEFLLQPMDYENIPFRCRRCHEHGHLIREFPLRKVEEQNKEIDWKDAKGFVRPTLREDLIEDNNNEIRGEEKLTETALKS